MSPQTSLSFIAICFISAILYTRALQTDYCSGVSSYPGGLNINGSKRVLITHSCDVFQFAIDLLKKKCDVTVLNTTSPTDEEVLKILPEYDVLLSRLKIDAKFINAAGNRLKIISNPLTGYDHLDVAAIKSRGIRIGYAPIVSSDSVAEIAVYLLLGATRRAHESRVDLENGVKSQGLLWKLGYDLRNKTIGIVGLGSIGQAIVKRLKPFEIKKFVYSGRSRKPAGDELGAEFVSFDTLLELSDFVICSVVLTPETKNMFNDRAFQKMKETAVFVNIARGKTVDTDALIRALKNNVIFAAGLDVTEPEPLPVGHELFKLPNVVITSHIGARTIETRKDSILTAVQNILNVFDGKPMLYEL